MGNAMVIVGWFAAKPSEARLDSTKHDPTKLDKARLGKERGGASRLSFEQ
jgi:hypothetical protein